MDAPPTNRRGDRDHRGPLARSVATARSRDRIDRGATACALGTALALAAAAWLAGSGASGARVSHVVLALALAFLPYAGLTRARLHADPRVAIAIATGLAALAGLALVLAPPVLSDDVWRYLWDARVLRHGIDPYAYAPDDPALAALRDAGHASINHPHLPTIYPPLAQLAFAAADLVAHAPWSMKLLALGAHLVTTPVVAHLARARAATIAPLFVLNPLLLEEAALGGHVDAIAGLWVALAVLALTRHGATRGALAIGAAAATKLVGLVLLPLLASRRLERRGLAIGIALGVAAIAIVPIGSAGHARDRSSGLGAYASSWRGNDGGFALLAGASQLTLELAGRASGAPAGWIRLPFLAPVVTLLDRSALDLHPRAEKKVVQRPTSFETRALGELAARGLALAIVLVVAIVHVRRRTPPLRAARDIVLALLLVSPQVHPWYLAWLVPIDLAAGGIVGLAWSAAILVAYAPLDGWIASRTWDETVMARVVEYVIVGLALWVERRRSRDSSRSPVRALARA